MKIGLCCIGRMENRYIREFVEHYKKIGVDNIFLYDNNYDEEEHFENVIGDYINDGFVKLIDFRNKSICQLEAYQNCYDKFNKDYDWICFVDIDEFLMLSDKYDSIKDFLSQEKFNDYDMIHINWKVYGDNDLVYYENKPLLERFKNPILPLDFKCGYDFPENNHIKSIVRGGLNSVKWNSTPHTPSGVKNCCNPIGKECNPDSPFNEYNFDDVWLNHYQTKTIEEWLFNKVKRGFPDGNKDSFSKRDALKEFFKRNKLTEEKKKVLKHFAYGKMLVILSMTTIPKRKERLTDNLPFLLNQSFKYDKLVINIDDNLSDEDYEWYENLKEIDSRIEINKSEAKWRSCNKLLPTLKKYPDDIIITLDDDVAYPKDTIKTLIEEHVKNPDCIIAHEINPILLSENMDFVSYVNGYDVMLLQKEWGKYLSNCCLFPPHVFDGTDLYDYDKMLECTNGTHDELWFWVQSTLNGVQCIGLNYVRSFAPEMLKPYEEGEYCLSSYNNEDESINDYMVKINNMYGSRLIEQIKSKRTEFIVTKDNIYSFIYLYPIIKNLYWYGIDVVLHNLTKDWKNKVTRVINGEEKRVI